MVYLKYKWNSGEKGGLLNLFLNPVSPEVQQKLTITTTYDLWTDSHRKMTSAATPTDTTLFQDYCKRYLFGTTIFVAACPQIEDDQHRTKFWTFILDAMRINDADMIVRYDCLDMTLPQS